MGAAPTAEAAAAEYAPAADATPAEAAPAGTTPDEVAPAADAAPTTEAAPAADAAPAEAAPATDTPSAAATPAADVAPAEAAPAKEAAAAETADDTYGLSEEMFKSVRVAFDAIDTGKEGYIKASEFKTALEALGLKMSDEEVAAVFQAFDTNNNNQLEFKEYVDLIKDAMKTA